MQISRQQQLGIIHVTVDRDPALVARAHAREFALISVTSALRTADMLAAARRQSWHQMFGVALFPLPLLLILLALAGRS
jgi:hypothetical protein